MAEIDNICCLFQKWDGVGTPPGHYVTLPSPKPKKMGRGRMIPTRLIFPPQCGENLYSRNHQTLVGIIYHTTSIVHAVNFIMKQNMATTHKFI